MAIDIECFVSMEEICKYLGATRDTVKKWIKNKNMPAYKIGKNWKFKISEVDLWMQASNKVAQSRGNCNND